MEEKLDVVVDSTTAKRGIDALGDAMRGVVNATKSAESAINRLFDVMSKGLRQLETSFFNLKSIVASFAVVIGVFKHIGDEITRFQAFISAMSVSTGGVKAARVEFSFLMDMADRLGISINSLSHNYSQMAAAAVSSGMSISDLRNIFESFSIAARVMHLSGQDTRLMFYALTQMVSKGAVSMEELRRQLGEKLPGAMNIAANSLNATVTELEAAIRKGIVDPTKFLPIFGDAVRTTFSHGLPNAVKALDAEINRLSNSLQKMIQIFFDLGVADSFTNVIKELNRVLSDKHIADEFGRALKDIADGVTRFLKSISGESVRKFVEEFVAALRIMANFMTDTLMPVVKTLAEWIGKIAAAWLILKGITLGAAAGTAIGGPGVGTVTGAILGGGLAGGTAYAIGSQMDTAKANDMGGWTGSVSNSRTRSGRIGGVVDFTELGSAWEGALAESFAQGARKNRTISDVTSPKADSQKKYEAAVEALKKRDAGLESGGNLFTATHMDIMAEKFGKLTDAQKQNLLSLAAIAEQQRSMNLFDKERLSDSDKMIEKTTEESDLQKKFVRQKFEDIQKSFLTEEALTELHFENDLRDLQEAERLKVITVQQANEQRVFLEEKFYNDMRAIREKKLTEAEIIERMSYRQRAFAVASELEHMTSGVAQHSKKLFELHKAFTIAKIILDTPETISAAYGFGWKYGGPAAPYLAVAMAGLAAGKQLALLQMARRTTFGGGGGGISGSIGGGSGPAISAQAPPQTQPANQASQVVINVTVEGNMVGNVDFVNNTLIPALRDAIDNRDVTIISPNSRQAAELAGS